MFSKRYAFTEWKQAALNWDSLNLEPWLTRVSQSKSDLEFFEICAEYVAKNQDGHTAFILPSDFDAQLPFDVDLYEGKFVLDRIDRTQLRPQTIRSSSETNSYPSTAWRRRNWRRSLRSSWATAIPARYSASRHRS